MTHVYSDNDHVSRLLRECALATPTSTPALANTLLALAKVLFRRSRAIAPPETADLTAAIDAALERHDFDSGEADFLRLWTPAIAEISRQVDRGEGAAALQQVACMLEDAGLIADTPLPSIATDRLWRDGRFVSIDDAGYESPLGATPRWFKLPGLQDKFVLPTREVILDDADVEVLWPAPVDHGIPDRVLSDAHEAMIDAVRWIAEISPEHLRWVDRLVCGFAVTEMPEGSNLSSGSYRSRPGVVHISFPLHPVMVAETLIHEASHQYYLLLNGVVPMVRQDTKALVFSPIKGCDRPIDRCALAHHACFNIWHFMSRGLASRYGSEARDAMDLMAGFTDQLGENIQASGCLTEEGSRFVGSLQSIFTTQKAA